MIPILAWNGEEESYTILSRFAGWRKWYFEFYIVKPHFRHAMFGEFCYSLWRFTTTKNSERIFRATWKEDVVFLWWPWLCRMPQHALSHEFPWRPCSKLTMVFACKSAVPGRWLAFWMPTSCQSEAGYILVYWYHMFLIVSLKFRTLFCLLQKSCFFCLLENCYLRFVIFSNRVPNAYCSAGVCFAVAMNWWNSVNTANVFWFIERELWMMQLIKWILSETFPMYPRNSMDRNGVLPKIVSWSIYGWLFPKLGFWPLEALRFYALAYKTCHVRCVGPRNGTARDKLLVWCIAICKLCWYACNNWELDYLPGSLVYLLGGNP